MLIDTVGFVRRLPHHLVEAFKSTLEEAAKADIILNVCDISSEEASLHLKVTEDLLKELGCGDTPIISVLNKCDLVETEVEEIRINSSVKISARTGEGVEDLLTAIEENLPVAEIRKTGTLLSEEYTAEGLEVEAIIDEKFWHKVRDYVIE